ncbi:class I adenylate-forming enzyme family protein [Sphingomonas silueang]|uniref:class I adenylate-forming enzyme family protein n=1 Tax=Sphingomonas silueang TaxID=3156617 RepID=UPI0032B325C4
MTDAGWPRMGNDAVRAALTAPDAPFEMDEAMIGGVATRVWKHAPPTLRHLLLASRAHGDRVATILGDDRVSYDAQYRAAATLARHLRTLGIGKGDRVALAMRNLPEWPVAFFAIAAIGAICVPLNAWWSAGELAFGLADSGARLVLCDGERQARIGACDVPMLVARGDGSLEGVIGRPADWATLPEVALPEVDLAADDPATIFYTSGTTGRPRGALGSHRNLTTNILSSAYVAARAMLRRGEMPPSPPPPRTGLMVIPFFHVTACSAVLMYMTASGGTIVLMHKWDAGEALALIARERVQLTGGVPTIAWQLLEHPDRAAHDLSSLEQVSYGGAPAASDLVTRIHDDLRAMPGNGWGMTETMATVTQHSGEDYLARPTSCGLPVPVADLKIMDRDGQVELPANAVGELWARGPMIVHGYWRRPEESAATFVDGWVRTGDIARIDAEGYLHIVDRAKDVIIRGGENIYSIEVEEALYAHPAVTDAAVVARPHRTLGEEPVAVVHLSPGADAGEAELQAFVRARLAAFKVPAAIRFSDTLLPRNANGKIVKDALRRSLIGENGVTPP